MKMPGRTVHKSLEARWWNGSLPSCWWDLRSCPVYLWYESPLPSW